MSELRFLYFPFKLARLSHSSIRPRSIICTSWCESHHQRDITVALLPQLQYIWYKILVEEACTWEWFCFYVCTVCTTTPTEKRRREIASISFLILFFDFQQQPQRLDHPNFCPHSPPVCRSVNLSRCTNKR